MNFAEQIWCVLSEEMSFESVIPICMTWSHVNEKKGKNPKSEISQYVEQLW